MVDIHKDAPKRGELHLGKSPKEGKYAVFAKPSLRDSDLEALEEIVERHHLGLEPSIGVAEDGVQVLKFDAANFMGNGMDDERDAGFREVAEDVASNIGYVVLSGSIHMMEGLSESPFQEDRTT